MTLAQRQAELVRALVGGGPLPQGFAGPDLTATREALMHKRAMEVRQVWPRLADAYGAKWQAVFAEWAGQRAPQGSLRDGWDFARSQRPPTADARVELAVREVTWRYAGHQPPRKRRLPAWRWVRGAAVVIQVFGRLKVL